MPILISILILGDWVTDHGVFSVEAGGPMTHGADQPVHTRVRICVCIFTYMNIVCICTITAAVARACVGVEAKDAVKTFFVLTTRSDRAQT